MEAEPAERFGWSISSFLEVAKDTSRVLTRRSGSNVVSLRILHNERRGPVTVTRFEVLEASGTTFRIKIIQEDLRLHRVHQRHSRSNVFEFEPQ